MPLTIGVSNLATNVFTGGIWPGATGNPLQLINGLEGASPDPIVAQPPGAPPAGLHQRSALQGSPLPSVELGVHRQLTPSVMLAAAYVGSHTDRLDYVGCSNDAQHANAAGTPAATIDAEKLMPFMVPTWHYSQSIGYGKYCPERQVGQTLVQEPLDSRAWSPTPGRTR